jgi:hypothetical protein
MPFPTFNSNQQEPNFCWLYALAGAGKSTLALDFIRANQPGVVIPMDQRYSIYRDLALMEGVPVWPVSEPADPTVWASADQVLEHLRRNFPGSGAKSLVWDSISPGFRYWVEWAAGYADMTPKQRETALGGKYKNKSSLYQPKSRYMEQVATITNYGVSCLWISHEHGGRDQTGQETMKTSITAQERLKFQRNVNLTLKIRQEGQRYGIEIEEARNRPDLNSLVLWDEPGNLFRGMWSQVAERFYAAEVVDWDHLEVFASDRQAVDLAMGQTREVGGEVISPFKNIYHAAGVLNRIKQQAGMNDAGELARAWKVEVANRLRAAEDEVRERAATGQVEPAEAEPIFATFEAMVHQLHQNYGLAEDAVRARLKDLGFSGLPKESAEDRRRRLGEMYHAVRASVAAEPAEEVEF